MPKGDREILKADPEDGTTPIANLLLDALAVASLKSRELRAIIYIFRRTYGWQVNGQRLKEAGIGFTEWRRVLGIEDSAHISSLLSSLENKNIIKRRYIGPTGKDRGYYYSINTMVAEWGNNCLNQQLLLEMANMKLPKMANITLPKMATSLGTDLATRKERLNKLKESNINQDIRKEIVYLPDGTIDEEKTIIHYQSLAKIKMILGGKMEATEANKREYRSELNKLGISLDSKTK